MGRVSLGKNEDMMILRNIARGGLTLSATAILVACDDTTSLDSIYDAELRDLALVAADATLEEINTMRQPYGFQAGPPGPGGPPGRGRPGKPGGGFGLGDGHSGTVTKTFYDVDGTEQDVYDELTTERIEVETLIEGDVSREGWSANVHRDRSMVITGLAGEETHRTHNGSGTSTTSRSRHTDEGERTYNMTSSFNFADVVVPIPGADPRYPVSGTISRSMTGTRTDANGTRTRSMEMTITFDGDETAISVVNGEEFEIDLSAPKGRKPWKDKGPGDRRRQRR